MERIQIKKIIFSWPVLILILVIVFFLIKADLKLYLDNRKAKKVVQEKQEKLERLTQEKEELEKEISQFETPALLEKILREQFQAKKPGEELLIITEERPPGSSPQGGAVSVDLFDKILKFLKLR